MLSHGYIENDFDVFEWAAPEFLEKAAAELLEEEWKKRSMARLPKPTDAGRRPWRRGSGSLSLSRHWLAARTTGVRRGGRPLTPGWK